MTKRTRYSKEQIAEALRKSGGIGEAAAKILGCTGENVRRRIRQSKELQAVQVETVDAMLDLAENKLQGAINKGNIRAITFYLQTKGRDRGYVVRKETTGKNGGPVETVTESKVHIYIPDNGRDPKPNRK